MKISGKIKKGSACLLTLALMSSGTVCSSVQAAVGIETERTCSVSFVLDGDLENEFSELKELSIPVKLYRAATVNEAGVYTALEGFEQIGLDKIGSETTAAQWEEMAKKTSEAVKSQELEATAQTTLVSGQGGIGELETGMYLVEADTVSSAGYEYKFTPYLLLLPNNYFGTTGEDQWVYDVTTGLKPGRESRLGSLVIHKTLTSYNSTLGGAGFVFQVEGELDHEIVYSNVVSMVFDGAGTKSITIDGLPAGAQMTVTEVYSGASYEATTAPEQTAVIVADGQEGSPAQVSFGNQYNGKLNGGSSVVNQFTNKNGVWEWNQQADSTADQN